MKLSCVGKRSSGSRAQLTLRSARTSSRVDLPGAAKGGTRRVEAQVKKRIYQSGRSASPHTAALQQLTVTQPPRPPAPDAPMRAVSTCGRKAPLMPLSRRSEPAWGPASGTSARLASASYMASCGGSTAVCWGRHACMGFLCLPPPRAPSRPLTGGSGTLYSTLRKVMTIGSKGMAVRWRYTCAVCDAWLMRWLERRKARRGLRGLQQQKGEEQSGCLRSRV
jgi:hypothetical protein